MINIILLILDFMLLVTQTNNDFLFSAKADIGKWLNMAKHTLKILRYPHRKILKSVWSFFHIMIEWVYISEQYSVTSFVLDWQI